MANDILLRRWAERLSGVASTRWRWLERAAYLMPSVYQGMCQFLGVLLIAGASCMLLDRLLRGQPFPLDEVIALLASAVLLAFRILLAGVAMKAVRKVRRLSYAAYVLVAIRAMRRDLGASELTVGTVVGLVDIDCYPAVDSRDEYAGAVRLALALHGQGHLIPEELRVELEDTIRVLLARFADPKPSLFRAPAATPMSFTRDERRLLAEAERRYEQWRMTPAEPKDYRRWGWRIEAPVAAPVADDEEEPDDPAFAAAKRGVT